MISDDPLHCYILEEAQRTGHIDIVGIYLARERGPLYIFLSQTRPIREYVGDFLSPNPPKDTDGRREGSGRGWVRELQGRWPGLLG